MTRRRLAAIGLGALILAGCGVAARLIGAPAPCDALFTALRCEALAVAAAQSIGVDRGSVIGIDVLPDPSPVLRLGGTQVFLRARLADASTHDVTIACGGIGGSMRLVCTDQPVVLTFSGVNRDVPCSGEPPAGCASPVPTPEPDLVAAARPLRIAAHDVQIERVGVHEIVLGEVTIPNGVVTEASLALADPSPDGVAISPNGIRLIIRSAEPGRPPFGNVYERGWWPGLERAFVVILFDVELFEPGAVVRLRNVVVR